MWLFVIGVVAGGCGMTEASGSQGELVEADGYRGIWYMNQPTGDAFRYKYSGGFATYPQQHNPIAIYEPRVNKTYFVYGGVAEQGRELLHMVSYFDHETGRVPRPRILLNKNTDDAHDNPVLSIDAQGYIWIFSNSHGTSRPSYIHRSVRPFEISRFERVATTNFSYGQPWHMGERGFLFLHTRYQQGRRVLFWMTSRDGKSWSDPTELAGAELGHYMVSWPKGDGRGVGVAFNVHPKPVGLNARTNLYYVETADGGETWTTASGQRVRLPIRTVRSETLVKDYQADRLLVYLKDVQYDPDGRPILLYLTSKGFEPGPQNGPRVWHTARWTGEEWEIRKITESDHNYDFGSIYILDQSRWRLIAPTDPGPQPDSAGGEVAVWETEDAGQHWAKVRTLTEGSASNHTYVRRPLNAHPQFAAFWADGDPLKPSESRLYFADLEGRRAFRLPVRMQEESAEPEPLARP